MFLWRSISSLYNLCGRNVTFFYESLSNSLRDSKITDPKMLSAADTLTLRLLMSYIYMEHLFLMFLDHTQRRSTVGRTPLDE